MFAVIPQVLAVQLVPRMKSQSVRQADKCQIIVHADGSQTKQDMVIWAQAQQIVG